MSLFARLTYVATTIVDILGRVAFVRVTLRLSCADAEDPRGADRVLPFQRQIWFLVQGKPC